MSTTSKHLVLAGDSIFDNDAYVMGDPGVIQQMRQSIPSGWSAEKVAVDGACIFGVAQQVQDLPTHTTDLIVSVGGNDALGYVYVLDAIRSSEQLAPLLEEPIARFAAQYGAMLDMLARAPVRLAVCTIYAAVPFEDPKWRRFPYSTTPSSNRRPSAVFPSSASMKHARKWTISPRFRPSSLRPRAARRSSTPSSRSSAGQAPAESTQNARRPTIW
jgi:hypothetical protein